MLLLGWARRTKIRGHNTGAQRPGSPGGRLTMVGQSKRSWGHGGDRVLLWMLPEAERERERYPGFSLSPDLQSPAKASHWLFPAGSQLTCKLGTLDSLPLSLPQLIDPVIGGFHPVRRSRVRFPEELTDELRCEALSQRGEGKKRFNQRGSTLKSSLLSKDMVNTNAFSVTRPEITK